MSNVDSTKRCTLCGEFKPLGDFVKDKTKPSGRRYQCKACNNERQRSSPKRKEYNQHYYAENAEALNLKKRQKYQANREEVIERQKAYNEANREARSAYMAEYNAKNKDAIKKRQQAYNITNKERIAEWRRRYSREFPEIHRSNNRNRRAKLRGADGQHDAEDVRKKYEEQRGRCYWCDVKLTEGYHVDHIIPISRGGGNGPGNICCSCPPCNRTKCDKMPWEFSDRLF